MNHLGLLVAPFMAVNGLANSEAVDFAQWKKIGREVKAETTQRDSRWVRDTRRRRMAHVGKRDSGRNNGYLKNLALLHSGK